MAAGFEVILAVTILRTGGALETSKILLLESVRGEKILWPFSCSFY